MAALLSQSGQKARRQGSKRKRAVTDECDENSLRAKEIAFKPSQRRSAADGDIDESIRHMDPGILADHISKKFRRFYRDLSSIELEDKYLPQKIFSDTSGFEASRTLGDLPSFLEHFSDKTEDLSTSSERPGSPHTLVIAASGMRAADVTRSKIVTSRCGSILKVSIRSLRKFQSQDSAVAKLFAKHIKLPEAVVYVKRTRYVHPVLSVNS